MYRSFNVNKDELKNLIFNSEMSIVTQFDKVKEEVNFFFFIEGYLFLHANEERIFTAELPNPEFELSCEFDSTFYRTVEGMLKLEKMDNIEVIHGSVTDVYRVVSTKSDFPSLHFLLYDVRFDNGTELYKFFNVKKH